MTIVRECRVLICDDEPDIRALYRLAFEHENALVEEAVDGVEAVEAAANFQPDLVVLDIAMPRRDGLAALPDIRAKAPNANVVIVTAHSAVEVFDRGRALGAAACFEKLSFLTRIPDVLSRYG